MSRVLEKKRRPPGIGTLVASLIATLLLWPVAGVCETEETVPKPAQEIETQAPEAAESTPPATTAEVSDDSGDLEPASDVEPSPDVESETDTLVEEPAAEELTGWRTRVEALLEQIRVGEKTAEDADALFAELDTVLWADMYAVREALRARDPDALEKRERLERMYQARIRLVPAISPELRTSLGSGGEAGMRELRNEFGYAQLNFFFQALAIPRGIESAIEDMRSSPLDDLGVLVQLVFLVAIFRLWRRWAKDGIPSIRKRILGLRPRRRLHLRLTKFLWYLDRCRNPLEWLLLLAFVSSRYEAGDLEEIEILVWTTALWLLLARFGILLIDAVAARSITRTGTADAELRLRSLQLGAAWLVLLGLGLDLTARYAGVGAIYFWVWRILMLLAIPGLAILLHWWRKEIIERLTAESHRSAWARRMVARKGLIASYTTAAAGAIFLLVSGLLQSIIRGMSEFESGRRAVAVLLRRELDRDADKDDREDEEPISEELAAQLLDPQHDAIDKPTRKVLREVEELIEGGRGGAVAVLAERGLGLSTFLRRVSEHFDGKVPIVEFPIEGVEQFRIALAEKLGIESHQDFATALRPRLDELGIRAIAIDNFQLLPRPRMGGLKGMDEVAALVTPAGDDILWLLAIDRTAWPYITRGRGDRALLQDVVELPAWSESQLQELFDARCEAAGIEPDYRRLVFPRQFDDGERNTLEERNRAGFQRILWDMSGGNPEVAMQLFVKSLRGLPNGRFVMRMPQPAPVTAVNDARLTTLLVLRVIAQCDLATIDDITASLRVTRPMAMSSIRYALQRGWIEEQNGRYRISWDWFRTVTTVLVRRNLLPR